MVEPLHSRKEMVLRFVAWRAGCWVVDVVHPPGGRGA
jgi:hypothetical protein